MASGVQRMSTKNKDIQMIVLKVLLGGRTINRRDFDNGSLHSWISTLRNERYIPIESSSKNPDGTCDYYMLPEEITRFQDLERRKEQAQEMKLIIECERQQKNITQFVKFLRRLVGYPLLWGYWDELPFSLDSINAEINALLGNEEKR